MHLNGLQALPTLHLPHQELAATCTSKLPTIGTPGHAHDLLLMLWQHLQHPACGEILSVPHVPQIHTTIRAPTKELRAVWTPGEVIERHWLCTFNGLQAVFLDIPHIDSVLKTATGEQAPIRTPGHPK